MMIKGVVMAVSGVFVVVGAALSWQLIGKTPVNKAGEMKSQENFHQSETAVRGESVEKVPDLKGQQKVFVQTEYQNPAGTDAVGFSVTVDADDVITDASVDVLVSHEISK
jgi:hypothetical protein